MMLSYIRVPLIMTALAFALTLLFGGVTAFVTVVILSLLEITFSFDNAIVNAKILKRMNEKWQKLFLTVGILIAVFGMRLVFPLVIVCIAAGIDPATAMKLATTDPAGYAHYVTQAHTSIAAFGGMFLLMLFLDWLTEKKEVYWIKRVERPLTSLGNLNAASLLIAMTVLLVASMTLGHSHELLYAGLLGLIVYTIVASIDQLFSEDAVAATAKAGLATFLYLEVLDASFSFDGVVGAFAITSNIIVIAIGLGIGALFIRGMTIYLTRSGKLAEYRYLEHGAHWAIGFLALALLATIKFDIPEVITGLAGIVIIGISFMASKRERRVGHAKP